MESFNPLPSCEGRQVTAHDGEAEELLQSTSLLRGKTESEVVFDRQEDASIHFPLAREDLSQQGQ